MKRATLIIFLASLMLLAGCESVQKMLAEMDKPSVRVTDVRFTALSLDRAGLRFDLEVTNPYSVALPLTAMTYSLATDGGAVVAGNAAMDGHVPAQGTRTISLPVDVVFAELLKAGSGVQPGQVVPYKIDVRLSADAPGVGPLTLPLNHKGEMPVPAVLQVALQSIDIESLTWREAAAVLKIEITNTNAFPIDLNQLGYTLSLGGTEVATTHVSKAASFQPGQTRRVDIPLRFEPSKLGPAAFNMLRGNGASYTLQGDLQLATRFGKLSLPYEQSGTTPLER